MAQDVCVIVGAEDGARLAAINRYIREHNDDPKPFVWTKSAKAIVAKIDRLPVLSE